MKGVRLNVWLQGGGEMASGIAVALVAAGCRVVIGEISNPHAVRRLVSFSEAIYEGRAKVAGVFARRVSAASLSFQDEGILIAVDPEATQLGRLAPDVVVDARMTKREPVSLGGPKVPLIGVGPGFVCGKNAALVVESMRGERLGQVIKFGGAQPYTGVPSLIDGYDSKRVLRAPAAGKLISICKIGDLVAQGDIIGEVAGLAIVGPMNGMLRGLVHPEVELYQGQKVGDVDPRGSTIDPRHQSDKAQAIGAGVWQAVTEVCRTIIDRSQSGSLT